MDEEEEAPSTPSLSPPPLSPASHTNPTPSIPIPIPSPLPASALLSDELLSHHSLHAKGRILTGCSELDSTILLGGFSRGSIAGISAEDEDVALRIGLQTVANLLVTKPEERVRIITTLGVGGLLPLLREAAVGRVMESGVGAGKGVRDMVLGMFERVEISRVFDFEGLWDVVRELRGETEGEEEDGMGRMQYGEDMERGDVEMDNIAQESASGPERDGEGGAEGSAGDEAQLEVITAPATETAQVWTSLEQTQGFEQELGPDSISSPGVTGQPEITAHPASNAMSNPYSSPLSSPPTSPVNPLLEDNESLPEMRPVPERIVVPIYSRTTEIPDSQEFQDSAPLESSPLSSPPLSSPPVSEPEEAEHPGRGRTPSEASDISPGNPEPDSLKLPQLPGPQTSPSVPSSPGSAAQDSEAVVSPLLSKPNEPLPKAGSLEPKLVDLPAPPSRPESKDPSTVPSPPPKPPHSIKPHTLKPPPTVPSETAPSLRAPHPDLILITSTLAILNTLFTGRGKPTAHEKASLLASQLQNLTRSSTLGNPLIILLNSTSSYDSSTRASTNKEYEQGRPAPRPIPREEPRRAVDQTLRSIFGTGNGGTPRVKPAFGNVFAQMLDFHLLCTRLPTERGIGGSGGFVWAIEVLLDEVGVYEFENGDDEEAMRVTRKCREQRWGVVEVDGRGRVIGYQ